jgi:hypothetical protein
LSRVIEDSVSLSTIATQIIAIICTAAMMTRGTPLVRLWVLVANATVLDIAAMVTRETPLVRRDSIARTPTPDRSCYDDQRNTPGETRRLNPSVSRWRSCYDDQRNTPGETISADSYDEFEGKLL